MARLRGAVACAKVEKEDAMWWSPTQVMTAAVAQSDRIFIDHFCPRTPEDLKHIMKQILSIGTPGLVYHTLRDREYLCPLLPSTIEGIMARGSKASQKRKPSAHRADGDGMELNSSGTRNTSARELLGRLFVFPPRTQHPNQFCALQQYL